MTEKQMKEFIKEVIEVLCDMIYWQHKHYQQLTQVYEDSLLIDGNSIFSNAENAKKQLIKIILNTCEMENQLEVEETMLDLLNKLEDSCPKVEVESIANEITEYIICELNHSYET